MTLGQVFLHRRVGSQTLKSRRKTRLMSTPIEARQPAGDHLALPNEIRRFEVAMDDAERVRLADRLAGLENEIDRFVDLEGAASREVRGERLPFEVIHHDEWHVAEGLDVVDLGDVGARDASTCAGLLEEALREVGARGEMGEEELERDEAAESHVLGCEDGPHAARAEGGGEPVLAEDGLAGFGEGHGGAGSRWRGLSG